MKILKQFFAFTAIMVFFSTHTTLMHARTLPLPNNVTALASNEGQILFEKSDYKADFWPLSQYFISEYGITFCGLASMVMVLNSLDLDPPLTPEHAPYKMFTQENIFYKGAVLNIATPENIYANGLTLHQLARMLETFESLRVSEIHASEQSHDYFINDLKKTLADKNSFMIINFIRSSIGESGDGHFSPIAAYNSEADQVLIMDVARYKYPPIWVDTNTLLKSMQTIDPASHTSRGYLIVKRKK